MSVPFGQAAFTIGELSPKLFGRFDLARFNLALGTGRNLFVNYQGGGSSRAGTSFPGYSKQTERLTLDPTTPPPRLITFQFNVDQGLMLEFGHEYMRIVQRGAYVVEAPVVILNITNSLVASVQYGPTSGGLNVVADNTGVLFSYAPGDQVTLAGGTYTIPAVVQVDTTLLLGAQPDNAGVTTSYAPLDTITLIGGSLITPPVMSVTSTMVVSATIDTAGASGAPGAGVVVGTTGTGTKFQANVTISGAGAIQSVDSILLAGNYTVNPTTPSAEPVTGAGLVGAKLNVVMGVRTASVTTGGEFTTNPGGSILTQTATSGGGSGVLFVSGLFGINDCHFAVTGAYTVFPPNPVAQASTTGTGSGVVFNVATGPGVPFQDGDWVRLSDINGMTELNGQIFVIGNLVGTSFFDLFDVFGNPINTSAFSPYTGGGFASRVYTIATPYQEEDLRYLKFTQSADVMTLCCVNQQTNVEYAPRELARNGETNWTLTLLDIGASVQPPTGLVGNASGSGNVNYKYQVTAVSLEDLSESVASASVPVDAAVDIAATAGTITLSWVASAGAQSYNVYKATPGYLTAVPVGVDYGFIGSANGTTFLDTNRVADFSQVPPKNTDPFARGRILAATPVAGGAGYTTATVSITTSTGSGAVIEAVIDYASGGVIKGYYVVEQGKNYAPGDTMVVTGDGAGATGALTIGEQSGTYPSVPQYFQQRLFFATSLTLPLTFWASQPGAFNNFDARVPPLDTDAITGSPISVQVNGIQAMINMPGGLVLLTGQGAYQLTGSGGSSLNPQPITPTSQQAQPQAFNGCHDNVPPFLFNYDIIYVQQLGSIVRDLNYNFYTNIYTGLDLTLNSSHLFTGFQIKDMAWCEEPYKLAWLVRDDGIMLSLIYEKTQEIAGWTRHDTQGLYQSVCSVVERPVNALYIASKRFVNNQPSYMIERMDNRIWNTPEDPWCVDVGVRLPQPTPDATLTFSSAVGIGEISGVTDLVGGENYSAGTFAEIVDDNGDGPGTGATAALTLVGGAIVAINITAPGQNYTYPSIRFVDPAGSEGGSGASAVLTLDNEVRIDADAAVFTLTDVGSVIRYGGGVMTVTAFLGGNAVSANMDWPIARIIPNTNNQVVPARAGEWTMTAPVVSMRVGRHLIGATVTGLYDGNVLPLTLVPNSGVVPLPAAATSVLVGLPFGVQLNSIMLNVPGGITVQGQRKDNPQVVVRVEASRDFTVGSNQKDGSTFTPKQLAPRWSNMARAVVDQAGQARAPYGSRIPALWTGDVNVPVEGGFNVPGQVAVQQLLPLPLNVLALIPDVLPGDLPETRMARPGRRRQGEDE